MKQRLEYEAASPRNFFERNQRIIWFWTLVASLVIGGLVLIISWWRVP
jgi:hypothetical protein